MVAHICVHAGNSFPVHCCNPIPLSLRSKLWTSFAPKIRPSIFSRRLSNRIVPGTSSPIFWVRIVASVMVMADQFSYINSNKYVVGDLNKTTQKNCVGLYSYTCYYHRRLCSRKDHSCELSHTHAWHLMVVDLERHRNNSRWVFSTIFCAGCTKATADETISLQQSGSPVLPPSAALSPSKTFAIDLSNTVIQPRATGFSGAAIAAGIGSEMF